jgi:hypothetical protein
MQTTHVRGFVNPHTFVTFAALQPAPEAGPAAALWSVLTLLALLCEIVADSARLAPARIEAARLANRMVQMGWRTWTAWESEAAYQYPEEPYGLERLTVEQAALRRLEAGLVGTPLLPKAGGTGNVRPFAAPQAEAVAG